MDKTGNRRKNLETLSEQMGQAELARRVGRAPQQINDMLNGRKSFGEKVADKFTAALGLPPGWFDAAAGENAPLSGHFEDSPKQGNTDNHGTDQRRAEAVVIDWDQVNDFDKIVRSPGAHERLHKAYSRHGRGFVLRMREDSMQPTLPVGSLVLIDPDEPASHNRIVLVAEPGGTPVLRRLVVQGREQLLKADNDRYGPLMKMRDEQQIVGVAIDAVIQLV